MDRCICVTRRILSIIKLRLSNSSVKGRCEPQYVPTSDGCVDIGRLGTHVHGAVDSLKPSAEVGLLIRTSLSSDAKSATSVQNVPKFWSKIKGSNIDPASIININYMWIAVYTIYCIYFKNLYTMLDVAMQDSA